jgi:ubiquinone/menaquinone biosynthesis C-methylase UbiE
MSDRGIPSIAPCGRFPGKHYPQTVKNDWPQLYSGYPEVYDEFAVYQDSNHMVRQALSELVDLRSKVLIDVGSGTGKFTFEFASLVNSIYSLEPCIPLLDIARVRARTLRATKNITFVEADAANIPLPNDCVDIAFSGHAIAAIMTPEVVRGDGGTVEGSQLRYLARSAALREMERVVKPGGWVFSLSASPHGYGEKLMDVIFGEQRAAWSRRKEQFLTWMTKTQGFSERHIDSDWLFPDSESAAACFGFIYGEHVARYIVSADVRHLQNSLILQFRQN